MEHVPPGVALKTFTRFLALSIAVLTLTAGAALGSIAIDLSVEPQERSGEASGEETQDDANSGKDAGDSKGSSLRLQAAGRYQAHFKDLDSDWYVHGTDASSAACVQVTASGERLTNAVLEPQTSAGTRTLSTSGASVSFGLATLDLQDTHFKFSTDGTKTGSKQYGFETSVLSASTVTADVGGSDASASLLGATSLPDGCFGGTMESANADTKDVYTFEGTTGDATVFTFAQISSTTTLEASLLRPDGTEFGRTGSGGSIAAVLDMDGSWYLAVEVVDTGGTALRQSISALTIPALAADSDTDYTVGACKPVCYE